MCLGNQREKGKYPFIDNSFNTYSLQLNQQLWINDVCVKNGQQLKVLNYLVWFVPVVWFVEGCNQTPFVQPVSG